MVGADFVGGGTPAEHAEQQRIGEHRTIENRTHTVRRPVVMRWVEKQASGLAKPGPRKTNVASVFWEPG